MRENIRQTTQTPEDAKFRTALENMRFKACTSDDIVFLCTRISKIGKNSSHISEDKFRNISIITAQNAFRDKINELGSKRFAQENNQEMVDFYSIDQLVTHEYKLNKSKTNRYKKSQSRTTKIKKRISINSRIQEILWELPPDATEHASGKLSLCIGLPIMIKKNIATELCITKGQEGTVAGWQEDEGSNGQKILDTLFVKLTNPAQTIQIEGLPENIVPLTRTKKTINCQFPNDDRITIERDQVDILPNFAMTDYASQGKTRPENVVHLNNCKNHHAYYTALSRSASASGTLILQAFATHHITGGASGWLRQEFRHLELLDAITKLRYHNELPDHVQGVTRNTLLCSFQKWKGTDCLPNNIHPGIRWNDDHPMEPVKLTTDSPWQIIDKLKKTDFIKPNEFIQAEVSKPLIKSKKHYMDDNDYIQINIKPVKKQRLIKSNNNESKPLTKSNKHQMDDEEYTPNRPAKKTKFITSKKDNHAISNHIQNPIGLIWDDQNYSCAYDAFITILYHIWNTSQDKWSNCFHAINPKYMGTLSQGFQDVSMSLNSLEDVRDDVRAELHFSDPATFPYGHTGTSMSELASKTIQPENISYLEQLVCPECSQEGLEINIPAKYYMMCGNTNATSTSTYLKNHCWKKTRHECPECKAYMFRSRKYHEPPNMLAFELEECNFKVSKKIKMVQEDQIITLKLRGLTYFGAFHYTSRVIDEDGGVWYHDGIQTGNTCLPEGKLKDISNHELLTCKNKKITLAIYAR